ncbi:enoyl-CoA hydratase domain-containing protein 3, mitochondrial [Topomyia yanbarensis]|uniref:enoyl-CoA hydratase domain-containing protein 3, mitochondrial n=1 Tax=Topomyia yanbarensis TaxID=2498891 RepID=UPI00273BFBC9|nr:enoyl-CoA hydratase domain-containing protein 3, mitochondrial [Topomyia yanbarensis]XP_058832448.1 enoyl-CoA hydratase domain-containing protein 3, mitochondrial [Topomyia yanbarensis]XP_058832449.1 enoyl-CoA hydratase domain-containing protein 3, mitochondrial [Topomyia yanbarensis]
MLVAKCFCNSYKTFARFSLVSCRQQSTFAEQDGVGHILLNNERKRNSLSLEMMDSIQQNILTNQEKPTLRCFVISAQGLVFSAGHNLTELTPDKGYECHKRVFDKCSEMLDVILKAPVPVIAKVDGLAAAAGCQLIASCDMVVCSDRSSFSTPGASFGIFCSTPGIAVARAVPRMTASYMLFTGMPIQAQEALEAGLVSRVVPVEQLDAEIDTICNAIKSKSRCVIALGKKFFYEQLTMDIGTAYRKGAQVMADNLATADGQEGIRSFVEKRKPSWQHT